MNIEDMAYFPVGLMLVALGTLTWKKQKVSFLHEYHYKNVKEEDYPAYTRGMGIGQIIIGAGFFLTGILRLIVEGKLSYAGVVAGLVVGFVIMHKAQMKYNGSWFG